MDNAKADRGVEGRFDILVVEDDEDTRSMIAEVFDAKRWVVRGAASVREAEVALRERLPDVVLSDLNLGRDEAGWTLAERLRQDPSTRHVARIAITGRMRPDAELEFDAYLRKPFDLNELLALVAELAELSRAKRVATRAEVCDAAAQ